MATHDVDQKLLGRLARQKERTMPDVYSSLCQLLGLSVQLAKRLIRARQLRKLDTSRETKSLALYQHIIWLSREGLWLVDNTVLLKNGEPRRPQDLGIELYIFAYKLRASFFHVFCLFHNNPTINSLKPTAYGTPPGNTRSPLSPTDGNGRHRSTSGKNGKRPATEQPLPPSRERRETLRETIPSLVSEASYITDPLAEIKPPPGLAPRATIPNPSSFLLPSQDYRQFASSAFNIAAEYARQALSIFHPLRLSIILEQCAFYWDCLHDYEGGRALARRTLREIRRLPDPPMDEASFRDVAALTGTLGRMMERQSADETPRPPQPQNIPNAYQQPAAPANSGQSPSRSQQPQVPVRQGPLPSRPIVQPYDPSRIPRVDIGNYEPTPSPSPHRVKRKPVGSGSTLGQIRSAPGINPAQPHRIIRDDDIPTPKPTPKRSATRSPSPRASPPKSPRRSGDSNRRGSDQNGSNGDRRSGSSSGSGKQERRSSERRNDERRSDERRSGERRSDERRSGDGRNEERRGGERHSSGSKSSSRSPRLSR